jgi:uncharacterized protein (TIGR03437 family)
MNVNVVHIWSRCFAIPLTVIHGLAILCAPPARAQDSPATASSNVTVNFATAAPTPLNPGFNGFNSNLLNAVEYYDANFQGILKTLSPGWLRFPGGTDSEAFDWSSGEIVPAWVAELGAKSYTQNINANAEPIVAGKGGSSFRDFASLAASVGGARIIVSVNAYTDTPQSAQAFAQYVVTNHIPVAAWELANEPYTWLNTDSGGPGPFFADATDYATKMKPFRDAIKAADPNAVVTLYFSEAGNPNGTWDKALANYSPKYWDAVSYHEYVFSGNLTALSDLMAAANTNLYTNTTSYVTDYLAPKNNPGMTYVISEVSPAGGQGGPLLGSLYGGIYTAEFALRMSTLPQVKYVAAFQVLSNAGIDETNLHETTVLNAYNQGTTVDTTNLNFGFFLSAQAAGEAVANGALHNSIGVYATTTTGGPAAPATGGASIPAIYAQAYQGGNSERYVVLTNKGAAPAVAQLRQDGAVLTNPMQMTFVTGTDPTVHNSGIPADAVQIQSEPMNTPGAVTIPPYSVVRLEWAAPMPPLISAVSNSASGNAGIAPNTWTTIFGANLAPAGDARVWTDADFVNANMPASLDGVSVTVNGKAAYVSYISPTQINVLAPPDAISGPIHVVATQQGLSGASFTVPAQPISPAFFQFKAGPYIAATHADGTLLGPANLYPGVTSPAKPAEIIVLYATGFGQTSVPVVSGSRFQSGTLSPLPVITIGGVKATVQFAGLVEPGEFQFNVVVPPGTPDGDQTVTAAYGGLTTQAGALITIQH